MSPLVWTMSRSAEPREFLPRPGVMRVNRADKARIVRAADMADLDGIVRIGDRRADQRFLHRAADAVARPRADIPGGRSDDLVVLDLAGLHFDPMAQRATNRLGRAPAAPVLFGRLDVPGIVQLELAQRAFRLAIELYAFMHAREMPQQDAGAAHRLVHVEHQRVVVLPGFAVRAAGHHLARERAGLEAPVFLVANGGRP